MLRRFTSPLTQPLYYVANAAVGLARFDGLRQHYMAIATESTFEANVTLFDHSLVHASSIGRHTYIGSHSVVSHATMGRFCCIGPGVRIGPGRHPSTGFVSSHPIFYSTARHTGVTFADRAHFEEHLPTTIGHDVWIGANAVVSDGLTIGSGAIIGAGAVVTRDVTPYAIVGGVPAAPIRHRFSDDDIAMLLEFQWWERDDAWLAEHANEMRDIVALRSLAKAP
jgi:acetyltransferase-like isoleucine patch superfamily enzyme